ncbi:unnamed protein product [Aureobasidium uvarum]|uniref:Haloacid dehalogenase n=1 Tax=Aureobasidium uvarum TaxID=2773716 RepID=A0A9N8PWW6_9PEZI|nr:unnamed protein product [Aureobasidium uvarum]
MKRNLLLCVDAFGTLFRPRSPIAEQYGSVARRMGVKISDDEVAKSFKAAFKETSKKYPNYGKKTDMGARQWWTEDGYTLFPDVSYLQKLALSPQRQKTANNRLVIGMITNSDDRVPDVLTSLGLRVNGLRYKSTTSDNKKAETGDEQHQQDIDFCIMSYDVGVEKPSPQIFDAAVETLASLLASEGNAYDEKDWGLLYVGDEVGKDAKGAVNAGWDAVLLDRGGEVDTAYEGDAAGVDGWIEVEGKKVPVLEGIGALGEYAGGHELLKV